MLENKVNEGTENNVHLLSDRKVPTLRKLAQLDPDIREFLRLVHEEELREKALELIEKAISKSH